jgi:hypothetical protein
MLFTHNTGLRQGPRAQGAQCAMHKFSGRASRLPVAAETPP